MKTAFFLLALCIIGCVPAAPTLIPVYPDTEGLVARYTFDSGYADSTGNYHLTDIGTLIINDSRSGNGSVWMGNGNSIMIPQGMPRLAGDMSFNAWVKVTGLNGTYHTYIVQDWSPGEKNFVIYLNQSDYRVNAQFGNGPGISAPIPANEWTMITITRQNTTGNLYVDGQLAATIKDAAAMPTSIQRSFGRTSNNPDGYLRGNIDEVTFWNRTLSQEEIGQLYGSR